MKKLDSQNSGFYQIKGPKLYLDDVEFLIEVMKRDIGAPRITDADYEYNSVDELVKKRGYLPEKITIQAQSDTDPFKDITIEAHRTKIFLYRYGAEKSYLEIKDYLSARVPFLFKYASPLIWGIFLVLFLVFVVNFAAYFEVSDSEVVLNGLVAAGILLLLFIFSIYYRMFYCRVTLIPKHRSGFFRRNSDKIMLLVIGSLFGALGTLFMHWIFSA